MACVQKEEEVRNPKDHNSHTTIRRIPDELWDEFKKILSREKPPKTVGRPIVPNRKVLDGILYILRTGCQWRMLPKEYGSGSVCHRKFQEWNDTDVFKKTWIKLLKVYDEKIGINWTWQSIYSIPIKSHLRGRKQETIPLRIEANYAKTQKDTF